MRIVHSVYFVRWILLSESSLKYLFDEIRLRYSCFHSGIEIENYKKIINNNINKESCKRKEHRKKNYVKICMLYYNV